MPILIVVLFVQFDTRLDYLNALLQCLFASKALVHNYLNDRNIPMVDTPYNRDLKEFFQTYRDGEGPFEALPFVESTLLSAPGPNVTTPMEALTQIFNVLIASQSGVLKELRGEHSDSINVSETLVGRLLTTEILSASMRASKM